MKNLSIKQLSSSHFLSTCDIAHIWKLLLWNIYIIILFTVNEGLLIIFLLTSITGTLPLEQQAKIIVEEIVEVNGTSQVNTSYQTLSWVNTFVRL